MFYCFRNRLRMYEEEMRQAAQQQGSELLLQPTSCMKLCMLCARRFVGILNRQPIVAEDFGDFRHKVMARLDEV